MLAQRSLGQGRMRFGAGHLWSRIFIPDVVAQFYAQYPNITLEITSGYLPDLVEGVILHDYDPTRSQAVPLQLPGGFKGYLQTDAYESYGAVCRANELVSIGCMAHARRKLDNALKAKSNVDPDKRKSTLAATALKQLWVQYRIEREIKPLTPKEKPAARQERALPLLNESKSWLDSNIVMVPPRSTLGKAMKYSHKQW